MHDMIANTHAWTDNDVSDDATGQARVLVAHEATANKVEAMAALSAENAELAERIKDVKEG